MAQIWFLLWTLVSIAVSSESDDCEYSTKSIIIKSVPSPNEAYSKDNFVIEESCVSSVSLNDNEVLLKALYISVDPYLSGVLRLIPGQIASSIQISQVMSSKSAVFNAGDIVSSAVREHDGYDTVLSAHGERSTYFIRSAANLHRISNTDIPIEQHLSILGHTGATAYYGLLDIGLMKEGESVFVSGAAGATGSIVGQIAKNVMNGYVVGTAGSGEKVKWLEDELKFDAAVNYKEFDNDSAKMRDKLSELFPNGIDVYFDNTGGFVTESVWPLLNRRARVVVCGQIANYNRAAPKIEDHLRMVLFKEVRVEGFLVSAMKMDRWNDFFLQMAQWSKEGTVVQRTTVMEGFEKTIDAFLGLFSGTNIGKMIVKVAEE